MKILLSSHAFYPQLGGIESASELLAAEFVNAGHEVRLLTQSSGEDKPEWQFEVFRQPGASELLNLVRWCDVFFHNNISLQTAWPLLLARKPWVIAHQTWIGRRSLADYFKRLALRFATNVSISCAVAKSLSATSTIIPNPYRDDLFYHMPEVVRDRELIFLGRLVSDKGVDLLITALKLLKDQKLTPRLTIVGSGPEEETLKALVARLGIKEQVSFAGSKTGVELARILNEHHVLVIPSRWAEPFGIVALEGIACGCVTIGSQNGGLPDAMGPCGISFPNGNMRALAGAIREVLTGTGRWEALRAGAQEHLALHTAHSVAAAYLEIFQKVTR